MVYQDFVSSLQGEVNRDSNSPQIHIASLEQRSCKKRFISPENEILTKGFFFILFIFHYSHLKI